MAQFDLETIPATFRADASAKYIDSFDWIDHRLFNGLIEKWCLMNMYFICESEIKRTRVIELLELFHEIKVNVNKALLTPAQLDDEHFMADLVEVDCGSLTRMDSNRIDRTAELLASEHIYIPRELRLLLTMSLSTPLKSSANH